MKNLSVFIHEYARQLTRAVELKPDEYGYPVSYIPTVIDRMAVAFEHNNYNQNGTAIRWTCKELGIKHTRKAINQFLNGI